MGCENVIERCGASGTSPSGMRRTISRGAAAPGPGCFASSSGGNDASTVRPVRGGGSEPSRRANGSSRGGAARGGRRSSTRRVSASGSRSASGRATSAGASPSSEPSPRRNTSPGVAPGGADVGGRPGSKRGRLIVSLGSRRPSATPSAVVAATSNPTKTSLVRSIALPPSPVEDTAERGSPFLRFAI